MWNRYADDWWYCLCDRMDEVIYEEVVSYLQDGGDTIRKVSYQEIERIHLNPVEGVYACQVPKGAWHTVEVYEPSVIFKAKDGLMGVKFFEPPSSSFQGELHISHKACLLPEERENVTVLGARKGCQALKPSP